MAEEESQEPSEQPSLGALQQPIHVDPPTGPENEDNVDSHLKEERDQEVPAEAFRISLELVLDEVEPSSEEVKKSQPAVSSSSSSFSLLWTRSILKIHAPILYVLHVVSQLAARNPIRSICLVSLLSIGLFVLGLATNFTVEVNENILWAPANSLPIKHFYWIQDDSSFPSDEQYVRFLFHDDGNNVLGLAQVARVFELLDGVFRLPLYKNVCPGTEDIFGDRCIVEGVSQFWNNSADVFAEWSSNETHAQIVERLSARGFPDGTPVFDGSLFGALAKRDQKGALTETMMYYEVIKFPDVEERLELEKQILDHTLEKRDEWQKSGLRFRPELGSDRSFSDEFERGIAKDIPLVPIVFIIMSVFTALFFARCNPIYSRSLLGFSAVVSVLLSICSGFGLLFAIGVNFTSMTQLVPFVIFGVGLDDSFIIMGSFSRTDYTKDTLSRIRDAFNDIGVSITLTSITSSLAFAIGCMSSVPAVYWMCLYAFPTVLFVYIYQITFFVACIVLDERRIQQKRRDCCFCVSQKGSHEGDDDTDEAAEGQSVEDKRQALYEGWMRSYACVLLLPYVKVAVILVFLAFLALCAVSASKLTREFSFLEVLPSDSYVADFVSALDNYAGQTFYNPYAFFRHVNHSDTIVQDQMLDYVDELVAMDSITNPPASFWLLDFRQFVNESTVIASETFEDQMDAFLKNPVYYGLHHENIVRDKLGSVTASRVQLFMDNVVEDVDLQISILQEQRDITARAPINSGEKDLSFFFFDVGFNVWEFYRVALDELILTTIIGIAVMSGTALIFVPHWTAVLFVLPMISILYTDLLGVLQWAGVHINAVSYVSLVISIGLLVDFVLHMIIRYYECPGNRHEKTVRMLETMGVSILVGGLSTFLGTLPLAFSTTTVFYTVFVAFLGLVTLGMGHSLILLPVILSLVGPEDRVDRTKMDVSHITVVEELGEQEGNSFHAPNNDL